MEEICNALSAKLSEAGTGVYAVFYEDELLDVLPENARSRETLEAAMNKLNNGGYIDVRYARGSAFCLSFIKPFIWSKPEEKTEDVSPVTIEKPVPVLTKRAIISITLSSLLGGLLGGLFGGMCALLWAVI